MSDEFDKYKIHGAYHWEAIDNSFLNRFGKYSLPLMLRYGKILSRIEGENKKVLEIGCGDGALVHLIAEKDHQVTGFDLEEIAIELAREKVKGYSYNVTPEFINEDFLEFDFKGNQYDYIVFADVIEHLRHPEPMIEKALDILKVNGYILFTTPAKREGSLWDQHHVKEYLAEELRCFLGKYSDNVSVKQFMPLKLYRLFQRHRTFLNLVDYIVNLLDINSMFSEYCMIFAAIRK